MTMLAENPVAVIGHNQAPLSPFEKAKKRIDDLWTEASHWLDGSEIQDEATAEGVASLLNLLREAAADADAQRVIEATPFDEGKAEVQARYNPLISENKNKLGKAFIAINACKAATAAWLVKKDAALKETARLAREEADKVTARALEAMRSSTPTNLAERAAAEELVTEAKAAEKIATRAENTTAKVSNMAGRAVSLRTYYIAQVTDEQEFAKHVWLKHPTELTAFLTDLAQRLVEMGRRDIPGVKINEDQRAQ